jgi:hypothetical protein
MGAENHDSNPWAKEYKENSAKSKRSDIVGMAWKMGENNIRVLPPTKEGAMPFIKYMVHWIPVKTGIKDRPIIHEVNKKCHICKFVSTLWSEAYRLKEEEGMTDKSPEVQKLHAQISKLRGKKTYDMNVIHREDYRDEKGVVKIKRLVAGPTIWKPIIELGNSEKWGNPSTASNRGYDLTVTAEGEGRNREYTILPDSERKALTEEELEAMKTKAYDLEKLREMTSNQDILDILENAKPPLDAINLKKVKKELSESDTETDDNDDSSEKSEKTEKSEKKPAARKEANDDDDDQDVPPPDDEDEDAAETAQQSKESKKDKAAFSSPKEEPESDKKPEITINQMDCRATYDPEDVGCQECTLIDDCKELKKEYKIKAKELDIDISNLSGIEAEKVIKQAIKDKENSAPKMGKMGKAGKPAEAPAPTTDQPKKRNLPF